MDDGTMNSTSSSQNAAVPNESSSCHQSHQESSSSDESSVDPSQLLQDLEKQQDSSLNEESRNIVESLLQQEKCQEEKSPEDDQVHKELKEGELAGNPSENKESPRDDVKRLEIGESVLAWKERVAKADGAARFITVRHQAKPEMFQNGSLAQLEIEPLHDNRKISRPATGSHELVSTCTGKLTCRVPSRAGGETEQAFEARVEQSPFPGRNANVECIAIYNEERKSYVLELVDYSAFVVKSVASAASCGKERSSLNLVKIDPRMQAVKAQTKITVARKRKLNQKTTSASKKR